MMLTEVTAELQPRIFDAFDEFKILVTAREHNGKPHWITYVYSEIADLGYSYVAYPMDEYPDYNDAVEATFKTIFLGDEHFGPLYDGMLEAMLKMKNLLLEDDE